METTDNWTGATKALLNTLNPYRQDTEGWPRSPRGLGDALRRNVTTLRLLGIEGDIVSPQHIFVHPSGDKILLRREYWSHGKGEEAVTALLAMMAGARRAVPNGTAMPPDRTGFGRQVSLR